MVGKLKKDSKGFTIIEVLIVLAIAGLIMLIVFLAVPALQRNSRNTQRKSDISNLLGAVQESVNNNNGDVLTVSGATVKSNVKFGFFDPTKVTITLTNASATTPAAVADTETITVANYAKCASATAAGGAGATKRSIVAVYAVETGSGGVQPQCQDL